MAATLRSCRADAGRPPEPSAVPKLAGAVECRRVATPAGPLGLSGRSSAPAGASYRQQQTACHSVEPILASEERRLDAAVRAAVARPRPPTVASSAIVPAAPRRESFGRIRPLRARVRETSLKVSHAATPMGRAASIPTDARGKPLGGRPLSNNGDPSGRETIGRRPGGDRTRRDRLWPIRFC